MSDTLCGHENFEVQVDVTRLTKVPGGPVVAYNADVQIRCQRCGTRFAFVGFPAGWAPDRPMVSPDRFELRAPIEPDGHATSLMAGDPELRFPSFTVRQRGEDS